MPRSVVALLVALAVGLTAPTSGAAAPAAPADGHVKRAQVSPLVARALGSAGEMRGMAINDVSGTGRAIVATTADFSRMVADGITSVSIHQYLYMDSPTGSVITTGRNTLTDAELELVVQRAPAAGRGVQLAPVLLNNVDTSWRGTYVPKDMAAFFRNYTVEVLKLADLAQRLDVELFMVGSENDAIANQTASWRALVKETRKHYRGAVSYMSTGYTPLVVKFWDALDLCSLSIYFSMGEDANPTYNRFRSAWREVHTPYMADIAKKIRRPIIYAEVGYSSQQHSFAHPERAAKGTDLAAPAAQADGYAAFLDVLKDNPSVYGMTWWRWTTGANAADTSYSPNNKPAECVLALRWSRDPQVREAAAAGTACDLHAFDQALSTVRGLVPA
jgi:hypothetical protein